MTVAVGPQGNIAYIALAVALIYVIGGLQVLSSLLYNPPIKNFSDAFDRHISLPNKLVDGIKDWFEGL